MRLISPDPDTNIKRLIWIYFLLLIFEGVLRKWVVPQLANPLLIVRDPVVILALGYAIYTKRFPLHPFLFAFLVLALATVMAALFSFESKIPLSVTVFGIRTNFLHFPLIFLMGSVMDADDVRSFGKWILLLSILMATLMVLQFQAPPSAWLNAGAGEGSGQIGSAMGKIRPAATFSYILGPMFFFAFVAAFLFQSQVVPRYYPGWLAAAAGASSLAAAVVSGSRSLVINMGIVFITGILVTIFFRITAAGRILKMAALGGILLLIVSSFSFFEEGFQVFNVRVEQASDIEGGASGTLMRALRDYIIPFRHFMDAPAFGYGLGMGTNAGAALLTGKRQFLLAESEWDRALMESGPFLGGLFILMRVALAVWLAVCGARAAAKGYFLPLLLLSASIMAIVNGGWGQPTTLGFATFGAGLCAASLRPAARPNKDNTEALQESVSDRTPPYSTHSARA